MLFHIKQTHAPADCPYEKGGPQSLFDANAEGVTLHQYYLAFPQHTNFFVIETDDIAGLQAFLRPGASKCVVEVTPVAGQPTG